MPRFEYIRPKSINEAIDYLGDPIIRSKPIAGGTDLLVMLRHVEPWFDRLVDVTFIPDLKILERRGGQIAIGSALTFSEIEESPLLRELVPFFNQACGLVGGPQIRNHGTIGGNVINAAACADSLPVLVSLDANIHLISTQGSRMLPVSDFITRPNQTKILPGELATHFSFNLLPDKTKTGYIKLGRRNAQAISRMTVAAVAQKNDLGVIDFVRFTPGSVTPQTTRFGEVEQMLVGQPANSETIAQAARTAADVMIKISGRRWSTEFKEPVLMALTERVLRMVLF